MPTTVFSYSWSTTFPTFYVFEAPEYTTLTFIFQTLHTSVSTAWEFHDTTFHPIENTRRQTDI